MIVALQIASGFVALLFGGEALVRGAVGIARRFAVSPLLIGLTLVGFGTSTPELIASVTAALSGSAGIAVGNVIGSNIFNVLLIIGIAAVIHPLTTTPAAFRRDGSVLLAASAALVVVCLVGTIGRPVGLIFTVLLAAYIVWCYRTERTRPDAAADVYSAEAEEMKPPSTSLLVNAALFGAGLAGVLGGAVLLVNGCIALARDMGVSEAIIGLTVVAAGTSLPELVTSTVAARRGHADVAVGNIVGSNIFNVLGILGVTAMISPLTIDPGFVRLDVWVMMATAIALVVFAVTNWRISRGEGAILLAGYVAYLAVLVSQVTT